MRRAGWLALAGLALAAAIALSPGAGPSPGAQAGTRAKPWLPRLKRPGAVVWAVGDGADGGAPSQALGAMLSSTRLDRFLYLGDVYDTGTEAEFNGNYAPAFGPLAPRTAPTIGNHEYGNRASGYLPYWERVRGRRPPSWYAISASGWQVISLDSNAERGPGSPQVRWLKRKLRRTRHFGSCRIAFMHHPRYSAGLHGDDATMATLWEALAGRASLLLTGHDHDYQRLLPIGGLVEIVAGSGGHSSYAVRADSRLAFSDDEDTGAVRIALRGSVATLHFVTANGRTLDSSTVSCTR